MPGARGRGAYRRKSRLRNRGGCCSILLIVGSGLLAGSSVIGLYWLFLLCW